MADEKFKAMADAWIRAETGAIGTVGMIQSFAALLSHVDAEAVERCAKVNCSYCRSAVTAYSSKPKRDDSGFWWHLAKGYPPRLCASQDIRSTIPIPTDAERDETEKKT